MLGWSTAEENELYGVLLGWSTAEENDLYGVLLGWSAAEENDLYGVTQLCRTTCGDQGQDIAYFSFPIQVK